MKRTEQIEKLKELETYLKSLYELNNLDSCVEEWLLDSLNYNLDTNLEWYFKNHSELEEHKELADSIYFREFIYDKFWEGDERFTMHSCEGYWSHSDSLSTHPLPEESIEELPEGVTLSTFKYFIERHNTNLVEYHGDILYYHGTPYLDLRVTEENMLELIKEFNENREG